MFNHKILNIINKYYSQQNLIFQTQTSSLCFFINSNSSLKELYEFPSWFASFEFNDSHSTIFVSFMYPICKILIPIILIIYCFLITIFSCLVLFYIYIYILYYSFSTTFTLILYTCVCTILEDINSCARSKLISCQMPCTNPTGYRLIKRH